MTWAAVAIGGVSAAAGIGSSIMGNAHTKRMAAAQERYGRERADRLREVGQVQSQAAQREIDALRSLRSMDIPAFRQANEMALVQAQRGVERSARMRAMARSPEEVRQALFGADFQSYIARESQRIEQYAALTQRILQATEVQQERALQVESQAGGYAYDAASMANQMRMQAGDVGANILGAVGQAVAVGGQAYLSQTAAADKAAEAAKSEDKWLDYAYASIGKPGTPSPDFMGPPVPPQLRNF